MAFALIIRNSPRIQASQSVFKINSKKNFTQIVNGLKKEPLPLHNQIKFNLPKRFMSSDHSKLWPIEKAVSVGLLGLVPLAIIAPNVVVDDLLAASIVIHFHWGLEACVVDYVRPLILGPVIPKLTLGLLYLISVLTLGGVLYYNHTSIGLGNTVRKIWKLEK